MTTRSESRNSAPGPDFSRRVHSLIQSGAGAEAGGQLLHSPQAVAAARKATSTTPIVFAIVGDPVRTGVVASLARPGGNITGLTAFGSELGGKRLALLEEMIPRLTRVAILWNPLVPDKVVLGGASDAFNPDTLGVRGECFKVTRIGSEHGSVGFGDCDDEGVDGGASTSTSS